MATIKEKAHEIGWEYSKNYDPVACRQEWCEMAARESANYVLEQIEELTCLSGEALKIYLTRKIKELKGEK